VETLCSTAYRTETYEPILRIPSHSDLRDLIAGICTAVAAVNVRRL
jgi:hypothetical protein